MDQRPAPRTLGRMLLYAFSGLVLLFLALPTLVVVPVSLSPTDYLSFPPKGLTLHWYREFLTDEKWVRATLLSMRIGLTVTVVATVTGTMASLAIVRGLRGGGALLNALVTAPLVIPTIVYAIAVLLFFSKIGVSGSFWGFVLAHSALAVPYVVLIVSAALVAAPAGNGGWLLAVESLLGILLGLDAWAPALAVLHLPAR